jgi:hypothetical protein
VISCYLFYRYPHRPAGGSENAVRRTQDRQIAFRVQPPEAEIFLAKAQRAQRNTTCGSPRFVQHKTISDQPSPFHLLSASNCVIQGIANCTFIKRSTSKPTG